MSEKKELIILLHGIARTSRSMRTLERALTKEGFTVVNINYPGRQKNIATLTQEIYASFAPFVNQNEVTIHFVVHSMGGLITRLLLNSYPISNVGKVVMLGTPNQGSEVADFLKNNILYKWYYGPAGQELTTTRAFDHPFPLLHVPVGVIAGSFCVDPFCYFILPKGHDGKVTIESTKLAGMQDHVVISTSHAFMMFNAEVIEQVIYFLKYGKFEHQKSLGS